MTFEMIGDVDDADIDTTTSSASDVESQHQDIPQRQAPAADPKRPLGIAANVVLLDPERGRCRVPDCGPAKDGRSYYCADHLPPEFRVTTASLREPRHGDAAQLAKAERTKKKNRYVKFIIEEINPVFVQGQQQLCQVPDEWLDNKEVLTMVVQKPDGTIQNITLWDPTLREQFSITPKQAGWFASTAIQFENSQMGKNLMILAETLAPWAYGIASLAVLGFHGYKLAMLRRQIIDIREQMGQAIQEQMAQQAMQQAAAANGAVYEHPDADVPV